jgi:hypothetical protein
LIRIILRGCDLRVLRGDESEDWGNGVIRYGKEWKEKWV